MLHINLNIQMRANYKMWLDFPILCFQLSKTMHDVMC